MNHTNKIVSEMFRRVKAKRKDIDTTKPDWFMKHSWTEKEQDKFRDWMVEYLMENVEARREIMRFPSKNKERAKKVANMFVFNYGWKAKKENAKTYS